MPRKSDLPVKTCTACGRPMVWRKKWARTWDDVKFCSERCRREAKSSASLKLKQSSIAASSPNS